MKTKKLKCVKCGSELLGKKFDRYCSNNGCILSYQPPVIPFDWSRFWWLCIHPDFKSMYYKIKNTLFKRYDLIRTNTGKGSWCDKDYLIFSGVMGLLVDYVESECNGECFSLNGWNDYKNDDGVPIPIVIENLYTDYKVTYKKMCQDETKSLDDWAKSNYMVSGEINERGLRSLEFKTSDGYTTDQRKKLFDKHTECERLRCEYEQELLHRVIYIRNYLWT